MKTKFVSLVSFSAIACLASYCDCEPEPDESIKFYIANETNETVNVAGYLDGSKVREPDLVIGSGETTYSGDVIYTIDSVIIRKGADIITFVHPRIDLNTYESEKEISFHNEGNWIEQNQNQFVYVVKEEFF